MLVASLTTKRKFGTTGCLLGKLICMKFMIVPGHGNWIVQKEDLKFLIIMVLFCKQFPLWKVNFRIKRAGLV